MSPEDAAVVSAALKRFAMARVLSSPEEAAEIRGLFEQLETLEVGSPARVLDRFFTDNPVLAERLGWPWT